MREIKGVKSPQLNDTSEAPRRILPSFTLTSDDLPELKDWKVGGVYFLKVKVEQTQLGKGMNEWETTPKGEKKMHARFQMLGIEAEEKEKENSEDEYARKRSKAPRM